MSRRRPPRSSRGDGLETGFRPSELIIVALIAGAIIVAIAVILLLRSGDDPVAPAASASATAAATATVQVTPGPTFVPVTADDQAIQALAQRSIEVLPAGQWPSLYDDFTPEFQARCSLEQFTQVGVEAATNLGTNVPLLQFVRLEAVTVSATTATANVVGRIQGASEYTVGSSFEKVGDTWKLAPVPDTKGCEAFTHITG